MYTAGWKWACTKEARDGDNGAFMRLFDYITGDNVESKLHIRLSLFLLLLPQCSVAFGLVALTFSPFVTVFLLAFLLVSPFFFSYSPHCLLLFTFCFLFQSARSP